MGSRFRGMNTRQITEEMLRGSARDVKSPTTAKRLFEFGCDRWTGNPIMVVSVERKKIIQQSRLLGILALRGEIRVDFHREEHLKKLAPEGSAYKQFYPSHVIPNGASCIFYEEAGYWLIDAGAVHLILESSPELLHTQIIPAVLGRKQEAVRPILQAWADRVFEHWSAMHPKPAYRPPTGDNPAVRRER